jgi:hypothetical protein
MRGYGPEDAPSGIVPDIGMNQTVNEFYTTFYNYSPNDSEIQGIFYPIIGQNPFYKI